MFTAASSVNILSFQQLTIRLGFFEFSMYPEIRKFKVKKLTLYYRTNCEVSKHDHHYT